MAQSGQAQSGLAKSGRAESGQAGRAGSDGTRSDAVGSDGAGDSYYPTDGNGGYDVTDYDIDITYDPASHHLDGRARIAAQATAELRRFDLDLSGLTVSSVSVGGRAAAFSRAGDHELVITPAAALREGERFTVDVAYGGEPQAVTSDQLGTSGWQISASGGAYAAGEPHSATTWFPANDTPRDKARFRLTVRVPDGWSAIANGVADGVVSAGGWTTFLWVERNPIATYLTTVAIDRWTMVRSQLPDGTPVVDAYAPGAEDKRALEDRLPEILAFLSEKFGPYPQDAAGGIFLAEDIGFSLETQTRPTYARWTNLETIVHENAHQWFGDSVSVRSWADICLNECFASYAQWLWEERQGVDLDAKYRAQLDRVRDNAAFWARPLYDMGQGNEFSAVYDKGALALHALRHRIGEQAFAAVLRGWPAAHRDGNASWPDFEAYAQQVAGRPLGDFFAAWFRGTQFPADFL
ncbi:M1 family metallopeptidase [Solihabitans fulvus]|uniref:Aminopeptidase N n=1 Tax=Solihabitans fulvus TaxID=1892852 RepID=A0A5B2XFD2_9PSEU|nr:M1 family metallopeptidase [Solihabitans fulvus]